MASVAPLPDPSSRLQAIVDHLNNLAHRGADGYDAASDFITAQALALDGMRIITTDLAATQDRIDAAAIQAVERAKAEMVASFADVAKRIMLGMSRRVAYATMAGSVALVILVGAGSAAVGWHFAAREGAREVVAADALLRRIGGEQGPGAVAWWREFMTLNRAGALRAECQGDAIWTQGPGTACQMRVWVGMQAQAPSK